MSVVMLEKARLLFGRHLTEQRLMGFMANMRAWQLVLAAQKKILAEYFYLTQFMDSFIGIPKILIVIGHRLEIAG